LTRSKDLKTLTLAFDKALTRLKLDAPSVDDLIARLAEVRAAMVEPVTCDLEKLSRGQPIFDPIWRSAKVPGRDGRVMAVRHPGFGWMYFAFPARSATKLGRWLAGTRDLL